MSAKFLVTYPCQNECGATKTDRFHDGAPIYECPGCGTQWIEITERPKRQRTPEEENPFLTPLVSIPRRELIVWENQLLRESLARGLAEAAAAAEETVSLGSFADDLETDTD